jgi:hypothetical protein
MGAAYGTVVKFVKVLSSNWTKTLPELLEELESVDVGHNEFFKLERNVSYLLASALNDVNVLHKTILGDGTDISPFVAKMSHAFLPKVVFQLEEFGFPRMLSRRVQERGIINFEDVTLTLHPTLDFFKEYGKDRLCQVCGFDGFDRYILEYFYDGLTAE